MHAPVQGHDLERAIGGVIVIRRLGNVTRWSLVALATSALVLVAGGSGASAQGGQTAQETAPSDIGLLMPIMSPARGRMLFGSTGCVVCHSINGVGGTDAPPLDASTMPGPMNPFDFVARMWRGAPAMIAMQNAELGHQIQFTGQDLADIVAFAHDATEQAKFSEADIPDDIKEHMGEGQ